jgi:serine protease DegQ
MRRLWLIFAQTVTVAVAILFVTSTLKPEWLPSRPSPVTVREVPAPTADDDGRGTSSYREAARAALATPLSETPF